MLRRLQLTGQWFFLRLEGLFNIVFGDKLNPLYYLGAITYFMLWVVVVSGLYLYVFFKTGVNEAYASVEYLTHEQWYLGGVMRSLHRYASDGIVLGMVLHLTRHFVFDHYRGFRWFSWISGILLLWLVYSTGINGYMLPWDKVAQFTVVATAEWFDWLPIFNGALVRNFIYDQSVSDRLFSLLSFIHIGFPLAVLALLWVHTQRVPRARTSPPWPIAASLMAALLVLSLVKPALSQQQAELSAEVMTLPLDWFYLTVYPLIYRWSPGDVWALVAGGTGLFLLLPWLPPKMRRAEKKALHVLVHPDNRFIAARVGETILDAGLREGIVLPFECRNGGCGACKGSVLYGSVDWGAYQKSALSDEEKRDGKALFCCAVPLTDIEIEYIPASALGAHPLSLHAARVEAMTRLAEDVMLVRLKVQGEERLSFYAGQYINILLDDGQKRSFSFATSPEEDEYVELHIRLQPGGVFTTHVFTLMKVGDLIRFEGPLGSFFLREDSSKPIIFVAGATGFAPVKSMLEHAFHTGMKRKLMLYWGVRSRKDMYMGDLAERWAREYDNFTFVPVLSAPLPGDHWQGRTGLVHEAILEDFPDLSAFQIYACGSAKMVEAAHPAFAARGLSQDDCFSDAFRLAPHVQRESPVAEAVRLGGRS